MDEALKLHVIGPDLYENKYEHSVSSARNTLYGGHILAVAAKAALLTLSPSSSTNKLINSVHSSFIRPTKPDISVTYKVYDKKDGALFSHRSVSATQEGKLVFTCFVSFKATTGDNEAGKLIYNNQEKPLVPGPDHPDSILLKGYRTFPISVKLPQKLQKDKNDLTPRDSYWSKPAEAAITCQDQNYHRIMILYASDARVAGMILKSYPDFKYSFFTSLDHSVWFNESHKIDANNWYLYNVCCISSSGSIALNLSRIYSEDGILVATAAQQSYIKAAKL